MPKIVDINYFINYFIADTNGGNDLCPHIGYRNNTTMTQAQYSDDINVTVPGYVSNWKKMGNRDRSNYHLAPEDKVTFSEIFLRKN